MEKIKVLYIDDELVNLNAFKASFRRIFDVYIARSADEGLKILEETPIEVIISDQRMPGKTGVDFFESILDTHPNPVRILLTAYSDINAIIDAINKGQVYRYVTKPWSEFELKLTIENAYKFFVLKEQNNKLNTKYISVFNESSDPIYLFDTSGRIIDYNKAANNFLEAKNKELHFTSFNSYLENKNQVKQIVNSIKLSDSITDIECVVTTTKNHKKICLASINTVKNSFGKIINYQAILKDVTERNIMNKMLLKTIIDTQEKERERISKDLHDGLGQTLAAIRLNVDLLKQKKELDRQDYNKVDNLIDVSTSQIRDICFDTLPNVLSEYGILKAIKELITRTQTETLTIDFKTKIEESKLDKSMEVVIYRIIQEFINNTIKHSEASKISISLEDDGNYIILNLNDNGKGFEVKDLIIYKGQGLKNIESRVKSLSGEVNFKSQINKGTEFEISFPININ